MARDEAFREAEKKITERSGGTLLDLSWMALTELPASLIGSHS